MSRNRPNSSLQIPLPEPFSIDLALAAVGASSFGTPFAAVGPDHVRRLLYLAGQTAVVDFTFCRASRELQVTSQSLVDAAPLRSVANHLWGLDDDLPACYESLGADPQLRPLLHQYAGLRMVRAACLYEALVSAILGQQISVASAQSIRRRLIGALGDRLAVQGEVIAAYPLPDKLLQAGSEGLHALGITRQKARYLLAMAEQASTGELEPDRFALLSDSEAIARLCSIPGVGRWTAEVALMYGAGRGDIFFAGDLALQTAVGRLLGRPDRPTERECRQLSERWSGWRSYAALYLLQSLKSR